MTSTAPTLAVIPARLGSTRLPRKPLHPIAGRPLIEWVWRRVVSAGLFETVILATDSEEVAAVAEAFGAQVRLTSPHHPSGTDRVAEVAQAPEFSHIPYIVNVQGDEPFVSADHLAAAVALVRDDGWEIGTVAAPLRTLEAWRDPGVVKVVRGEDGAALLFTRAPVPHRREGEPGEADFASGAFLQHIGIYSYRRDALLDWVARPVGALERLEALEQLRPLAAGRRIGVALVRSASHGVDTPADARRAEERLLRLRSDEAGQGEPAPAFKR